MTAVVPSHPQRGERRVRGGHAWELFVGFLRIGALAFGGGSATRLAMRRLVVERGWMSPEQFLDTVVLSALSPGVSILAQVALIGRSLAGAAGAVAGIAGLILPSVTITAVLAQIYGWVSDYSAADQPLLCVSAVAAGFALYLAAQLAMDTLGQGSRRARTRAVGAFVAYVVVAAWLRDPVVVLVGSAALGALAPRLFPVESEGER